MANICRRLTPEEEKEWTVLSQDNSPEGKEAQLAFLGKVMSLEAGSFPREQLSQEQPVQEPIIYVESVGNSIYRGIRLSVEETQFYQQHFEEIEKWVAGREALRDAAREISGREHETVLGKLIQDLTYNPSQSMPRLGNLDEELERVGTALDASPDLRALIRINKKPDIFKKIAKDTIDRLQTELRAAENQVEAGNKEAEVTVKEKSKVLKGIAKDAKLGSKTFLTSTFDSLPPTDQMKVAITLVPDHSISSGIVDDFRDTALVMSDMGGETGLHFLNNFERIETVRGYCLRLQDSYYRRIAEVPRWRKIIRNRKAMEQVAQVIDSHREGSTTKVAEPVTEEDFLVREIASAIEAVYKEWQPIVRFQRFYEAYETGSTIASIKEKIPDAPEEDIEAAIVAYELGGEDALWTYLGDKSWGVIGSGYSPWRISKPDLDVNEPKWTTVRGAGYLMSRDSTKMPWEAERGLLRTFDAYNLSMALRFFLRKEVQSLADNFYTSYNKWSNPDHVQDYLRKYLRAVQGFPEEDANFFLRIMRKMQSWSYPNIFWHPWVGFRNVLQFVWSHPYRTELIRSIWEYKHLPASLRAKGAERFATTVDQSGRPLRAWMFQDEEISILGEVPQWLKTVLAPSKLITKPLDFLAALTAKIPTIAITDKASRSATYMSMLNKAWRATEQYRQDGNAKRWFDNSGINSGYISREQQSHIIGLLALGDNTISWAIPGLTEVSGYEAASIRIAEETTNRTLYLYDRAIAAGVHRGGGRTFASLFTFPRSTIQMYGQQVARVFSKDSTATERLAAAKHIFLLWLVGDLLSSFLMMVSGRRKKEYTIISPLTWSFGGLGVGIAVDVTELMSDIVAASAGTEEDKGKVWERIIQATPRVLDVLVGFYRIAMDTVEERTDEIAGLDKRWFRKIRAFFDEKYTPEEQDKAERTILERVQKIVMGSEPPDPDVFEKAQKTLFDEEARLGEIAMGKSYTVQQFGGKIDSVLNTVPDYLITEEAGWSELVMFWARCNDAWDVYNKLPSTPTEIRQEWRQSHLEEEAIMLFWGKLDKSVWRVGSPEGKEIMRLLRFLWDRYNIDRSKRPEATWLDGGKIVEE